MQFYAEQQRWTLTTHFTCDMCIKTCVIAAVDDKYCDGAPPPSPCIAFENDVRVRVELPMHSWETPVVCFSIIQCTLHGEYSLALNTAVGGYWTPFILEYIAPNNMVSTLGTVTGFISVQHILLNADWWPIETSETQSVRDASNWLNLIWDYWMKPHFSCHFQLFPWPSFTLSLSFCCFSSSSSSIHLNAFVSTLDRWLRSLLRYRVIIACQPTIETTIESMFILCVRVLSVVLLLLLV